MLSPKNKCDIYVRTGYDGFGQEKFDPKVPEKCSIVKLLETTQQTSVRADRDASRAYAEEFVTTTTILLMPKTVANINDKLIVAGIMLRIKTKHPRFDTAGAVDHYQVECEIWA